MTVQLGTPETLAIGGAIQHPLEPLSAEEIAAAVALVREGSGIGNRVRFASITLHEPPKETVLTFRAGDPVAREAFIILLDTEANAVYEAVVSLTEGAVV